QISAVSNPLGPINMAKSYFIYGAGKICYILIMALVAGKSLYLRLSVIKEYIRL
ncbi:hypothetical protein BO83DRAFT_317168, partial [Aspergillus eucalypticola CBS 122712]